MNYLQWRVSDFIPPHKIAWLPCSYCWWQNSGVPRRAKPSMACCLYEFHEYWSISASHTDYNWNRGHTDKGSSVIGFQTMNKDLWWMEKQRSSDNEISPLEDFIKWNPAWFKWQQVPNVSKAWRGYLARASAHVLETILVSNRLIIECYCTKMGNYHNKQSF
jgi:hypothetical protein